MSYNTENLTKLSGLKALAQRIENDFAKKADVSSLASAFKSGKVNGNTVSLYTSTDMTGAAAFTFDFPKELFLDQTKTTFVGKFTWSEETYPGSTNPSLNGKPVMVLAVKGENPDSCTYSFLNMAALVDTYSPKAEGKDASTTIEIAGYEVEVKVNISAEANNILELKSDGLFVPKTDMSGKADKVTNATEGNFAGLDANGNPTDSGKKASDFVAAETGKRLMTDDEGTKLAGISEGANKVEASAIAGNIKINGVETAVVTIATDAEVTEMLNEVFGDPNT